MGIGGDSLGRGTDLLGQDWLRTRDRIAGLRDIMGQDRSLVAELAPQLPRLAAGKGGWMGKPGVYCWGTSVSGGWKTLETGKQGTRHWHLFSSGLAGRSPVGG